ncbi:hypothetical protein NSP_4600 [Nodularia spumigena CCY9414]|nr:hypothetical protein NSP_4600 [Nodularia spumigena CCY9414]
MRMHFHTLLVCDPRFSAGGELKCKITENLDDINKFRFD